MSLEDVRKEMVDQKKKGLVPTIADWIGDYVKLRGSEDLLENLLNNQDLTSNQNCKRRIRRYETVDYYTGLTYKAVVKGSAPPIKRDAKSLNNKGPNSGAEDVEDTIDKSQIGVGSIAAGGRYDDLVGMFSGRDKINCESSSGKEVDVYKNDKTPLTNLKAISPITRTGKMDESSKFGDDRGYLKLSTEEAKFLTTHRGAVNGAGEASDLPMKGMSKDERDWNGAAQVLKDISLDGSNNQEMYDEYKLRTYIRIVRLLLEDDDPVSAETYLNRASLLIPITTDQTIILSFKLSQARIFDSKRRFEEASKKYHKISLTDQDLAHEERSFCLSASMAGPARTRILRDLYRDNSTRELPNFAILSKMFYNQLIRPDELVEFKKTLKTHHLAKLNNSFAILEEEDDDDNSNSNDDEDWRMIVGEDGESCLRKEQVLRDGPETVLDQSIIQHNLLSTSKLYRNISFRALGKYLGLKPFVVESMVRVMIQENQLRAKIDQVDGFIDFDDYCKTDEIESEQVLISNVVLSGSNQKDNTSEKDLTQINQMG
ncbi:hypothetical protein BY996DRAFT_6474498 [Phakopsora pachyrhizi]|nr:hypothetical protein BY996DRAFT_6474498 [Phakopsora pachyrhizi]